MMLANSWNNLELNSNLNNFPVNVCQVFTVFVTSNAREEDIEMGDVEITRCMEMMVVNLSSK